jgi:hypothetical protein
MDPNFLLIAIGFLLTVRAWVEWSSEPNLLPPVRAALFVLGLCATLWK